MGTILKMIKLHIIYFKGLLEPVKVHATYEEIDDIISAEEERLGRKAEHLVWYPFLKKMN